MPEAHASIYVGIDVSKDRLAVAIATGERRDEVLSRMRRFRPIDFAIAARLSTACFAL